MASKISQFYKTFGVEGTNEKDLKKEKLYNLIKVPKKDKGKNMPHIDDFIKNATQQADILFLPNDDGYKYIYW